MRKHKFPASLPRKMYWDDEAGGLSTCPDCHGALRSEPHTYLMATRRAGKMHMYMVGNPGGHFCGGCPVVVLEREKFAQAVSVAERKTRRLDYAVLGIIDLGAIPKDKKHLPFDDETNPVPLVAFLDIDEPNRSRSSGSTEPKSTRRKNQEKRERRERRKKKGR